MASHHMQTAQSALVTAHTEDSKNATLDELMSFLCGHLKLFTHHHFGL